MYMLIVNVAQCDADADTRRRGGCTTHALSVRSVGRRCLATPTVLLFVWLTWSALIAIVERF